MGDASGIGPEIIVKAWQQHPALFANAFVVGDLEVMRQAVALWAEGLQVIDLGRALPLHLPQRAASCALPVLSGVQIPQPIPLGVLNATCGAAASQCVRIAAQLALQGQVQAVVTAPLNKEAMHLAGVSFPGHTEILAAEAGQALGSGAPVPVRMMLMNPGLKVVLHSIHVPLSQALREVTVPSLLETFSITHAFFSRWLGRAPRIDVAGLNPHAGENGLMGREELDTIVPAIKQARTLGMKVNGPYPPDTVFMSARAQHGALNAPDAVIAMYHDQGLIPVKYMGLEEGVNVTLGLPFVRTSPDHGTAFDIAGKGIADPSSLISAMRAAVQWIA